MKDYRKRQQLLNTMAEKMKEDNRPFIYRRCLTCNGEGHPMGSRDNCQECNGTGSIGPIYLNESAPVETRLTDRQIENKSHINHWSSSYILEQVEAFQKGAKWARDFYENLNK